MKSLLDYVLALSANVKRGTSAYIDDFFVNKYIVSAKGVVEHLSSFGLTSKAPGSLERLKVWKEQEKLLLPLDDKLDEVPIKLKRRTVFSICVKLVGHYPVCGCLRVAAVFIMRRANRVTESWDEVINDNEICVCLKEAVDEVRRNDPVREW